MTNGQDGAQAGKKRGTVQEGAKWNVIRLVDPVYTSPVQGARTTSAISGS